MMCACWILRFSSALTSSPLLIKDLVLTPVLLTISLWNIYIEYIPYVYNFLKAGQLKAGLSSFIQQPVRVHVLLNGAAYRLILVRGAWCRYGWLGALTLANIELKDKPES